MCDTSEKAVPRGYLISHESKVDIAHSPEVVSKNDRAKNSKANLSEQKPVFGTSEHRECQVDIQSFEGMVQPGLSFNQQGTWFEPGSTSSSHSFSVMISLAIMHSDCMLCPVYSLPHITRH